MAKQKLKSHSGAKKRFFKTGTGKFAYSTFSSTRSPHVCAASRKQDTLPRRSPNR